MRWTTRATWVRIVVLACVDMGATGIWFGVRQMVNADNDAQALALTILFIALPLLTIAVAAWDGVKEGFSLLWFVAPFVCFLAPMFLFLNDSALIYGVGYSILGFAAHGVGALIHARRARGRG